MTGGNIGGAWIRGLLYVSNLSLKQNVDGQNGFEDNHKCKYG